MKQESVRNWEAYFKSRGVQRDLIAEYTEYIEKLSCYNVPVIFEIEHLSALLGLEYEAVRRMIFAPQKFYRTFDIPKRSGGTRKIIAPYPSLKTCQRWIYKNILVNIPVSINAHGFKPSASILSNAKHHVGARALLKIDLKDFFPSIPINWVINFFQELGYSNKVSFCLASLCCYEGKLPQGAPTSPYLTNILLRSLDKRLWKLSKKYKLAYSRYADDMTFSGNFIPKSFVSYVQKIIKEYGLIVNEDKTRLCLDGDRKVVTGIVVSGNVMTVPRSYKREVKKALYFIKKFGFVNHITSQRIKDPNYLYSVKGKLQWVSEKWTSRNHLGENDVQGGNHCDSCPSSIHC